MYIKQALFTLALCALMNSVLAVNIYECVDQNGNRAFQDHCPPGTTRINEKTYLTSKSAAYSAPAAPLTLYLVPGCDTCEQLKEFLNVRNVRYDEKDVSESIEMQDELKGVAGELQVPTLLIGDKVLQGYNRSALLQSLTESGYIAQE